VSRISIEGESLIEILQWPEEYFDNLVLIDQPIAFKIGTAEVLGQFANTQEELIVELAQIEGGGEGVLPAISKLAHHIAKLKSITTIVCIVHALNCAETNLKLRAHLEKTGFAITHIPGKGKVYCKRLNAA
jgi:hypothetical protein